MPNRTKRDAVGALQNEGEVGLEDLADDAVTGRDHPGAGRPNGDTISEELLREDNIRHLLDRYGFAGERGADL